MLTKKQKKLLLECVEHFMSWEQSMGRSNKEKITTKVMSFLWREDKIINVELIPTNKTIELENICKLLAK
jgi:hypothetical protein